jgi:iron complex outermembrane receptor protein
MGLIVPSAAFSQDSPEAESKFGIEEVVVTARKVEESIQDIPLSVTAFSAAQIQKQAIANINDIIKFTPGVVVNNQTGSRRYPAVRFRSIDSSSNERNKSTSSAFLDGVYLSGSSQWISMNDIERVEVVKGPQSAFFGRATFAGAINYITKTPGNEFAGEVQATFGSNGRQDYWLSAEGPIIKDKLSFRVTGRYYTYDGGWDNDHPSGGDIGAQETETGSLTLFATPTDDLTIKFRHSISEDDDGLSTQFMIDGTENNCGPFFNTDTGVQGTNNYYCGTLDRDLITGGTQVDNSPLVDTQYADELGLKRETTFTSVNIDWDINGSGYVLSSITGAYKEETSEYKSQIIDELDVFVEWTDESISQELRITSPQDQPLRWMVGAYYLDLEYYKDGRVGFPSPGPQGPFSNAPRGGLAFGVNPQPTEDVENRAIFGSVAFDITDQLTLSVELRREEETIDTGGSLTQEAMPLDFSTDALAVSTAQPFGGATVPLKATFKATLPRVILDYKLSDNTLIYLNYAEGNTPGGFNPEVIQLEPTVALPAFQAASGGIGYEVEQGALDAYEFGWKHTLADGRGTFNGAIYQMEWTNQRFRGFEREVDSNGTGSFIAGSDRLGLSVDYDANGSTDIWGIELSGSYAINENWVVSAGYNYNESDIQVYDDTRNLAVLGDADASGLSTGNSPDETATFSIDFNMPADNFLDGDGEWFARWDTSYQGQAYAWTINRAKTEAAFQHNFRGGWQNERYSVTAWVENLTDDDSILAAQRTSGSFLTGNLGFFASLPEPRSIGLTVRANFGG